MNQAGDLFFDIVKIRSFEELCLDFSSQGLIDGSIHLCRGQEAVPVGVASVLDPSVDRVVATYRGHGWALALGAPVISTFAEVAHKAEGLNGGRAGSAMLSWPAGGFIGETSIVGAGAPIGCGLGFAMKQRADGGAAVVSLGDGAMNQGAVFEALNFAAVHQLPTVFVCEDNKWAEMTPGGAMTAGPLEQRAAAFGMAVETCDGTDVYEVIDAATRAIGHARAGKGPVFVLCDVERLGGHYNRDIEHYRSKADKERAEERDPIVRLRARHASDADTIAEFDLAAERAQSAVEEARTFVLEEASDPSAVDSVTHTVASRATRAESEAPTSVAEVKELTFQMALNTALSRGLESDDAMFLLGEDIGRAGGIFGVTRRLWKDFGADRVVDTPISESAILGTALGASLSGLRPVAEIMWADFVFVALDQIVNQAANVRYVNRGQLTAPLVVRMQQGITAGSCAQHSQLIEGMLANVPGIQIGLPSTPDDAYNMLQLAIASADPTVFIEARELYQAVGEVNLHEAADPSYWRSNLVAPGSDAAIVTWGTAVPSVLEAADVLRADHGIEAGVLDLRWLAPLDREGLLEHVEAAGGKALIVHDAPITGGFGGEVASQLHEAGFVARRCGARDSRIPASSVLQSAIRPSVTDIVGALRDFLA